jgi:hypothetical protein
MATFDFSDFYIKYPGHPSFNDVSLIQDDIVLVIVQKVEMILFTNKGEVFGDRNFGADLELLLHETKVSAEYVKKILKEQFMEYIPELNSIPYDLNVSFSKHPVEFYDMLFIDFKIKDYEVNAYFS